MSNTCADRLKNLYVGLRLSCFRLISYVCVQGYCILSPLPQGFYFLYSPLLVKVGKCFLTQCRSPTACPSPVLWCIAAGLPAFQPRGRSGRFTFHPSTVSHPGIHITSLLPFFLSGRFHRCFFPWPLSVIFVLRIS